MTFPKIVLTASSTEASEYKHSIWQQMLSATIPYKYSKKFFDIFNHANFGQPGRTAQVGSATFGVITGTRFATGDSGSSRQIQFAMKFLF